MSAALTIVCCGPTATARHGGFADHAEPLDEPGLAAASRLRLRGPANRSAVIAPSEAARQTATATGLAAATSTAIADVNWGEWTGRTFDEVQASSSAALMNWLADPDSCVPGGEGLASVRERVTPWLDSVAASSGGTLAITHPMVVRVMLGLTIGMATEVAMRIDIAPLSITRLSFNRGWRLQALRRT